MIKKVCTFWLERYLVDKRHTIYVEFLLLSLYPSFAHAFTPRMLPTRTRCTTSTTNATTTATAAGRVRIFHGANRVAKAPPWYFDEMLEGTVDGELMEQLGFNVVRLGFMWSGYNPAPGVFNTTYMQVIETIIAKLNGHGVYVLLDLHEDILSSKFCTYDGVPLWVVNKSVPKHPFPWPLGGNCSRDWEDNALACRFSFSLVLLCQQIGVLPRQDGAHSRLPCGT